MYLILSLILSALAPIFRKRDTNCTFCRFTTMDPNLMFFYGETCPFTKKVGPAVECLELSLLSQGQKGVTRLEVYNNKDNSLKYAQVGGPKQCGGVPFFYNASTGESICGSTSCDRLKAWARV